MQKVKLSIIIPVYNVEEYLQQCLESVVSQYREDLELIAVNDGATDSSRDILEEFQTRFPELIIIDKENGGLSSARNSGLHKARGEYIYFLDSDDYLLEGVLDKMLNFIEEKKTEVAQFNALNSDGRYYFPLEIKFDKITSGTEYLKTLDKIDFSLPAVPVWLYLYRRDFLLKNNLTFDEGIIHEDVPFTLKTMCYAEKICLLNIPIQHHRVKREGAITSGVSMKHVNSMLFISRSLYQFIKAKDCIEKVYYKKIFLSYINNGEKILNLKSTPKKIFTKEDGEIMKACLYDNYMAVHYLLLKHNLFGLYSWYINDKNLILKKNIRRLIKLLFFRT